MGNLDNKNISSLCVHSSLFNREFIKSLDKKITNIKIQGEFCLTKKLYDDLVVFTNVSVIDVYDVEDFEYGDLIKINIEKKVFFNSPLYKKFNINKVDKYTKNSLTIDLPFKLYFDDDCLLNEEDDFNELLKYVDDLEILNINISDVNVVDDIIRIVYQIEKKINKKIQFINCVTLNRTIKDIEKLCFLEDDRIIKVWYEEGITDCSILEFISMRKGIDSIISEVNDKNLTNFEKIIYVYDIVKKFNYCSSLDNYSMDGRQLHKIFNTNKIVCSGFSRIVTQVFNELGIKSCIYKLITRNNILHARSLVHIVDEHYGINAICSMEPTWESAFNEENAYSLFLTPIDKLKQTFPNERFREDIDVLCGNKKISEIYLRDRISLYQFFNNKDLCQDDIDSLISKCSNNINLSCFINALMNVRQAQGVSKNVISSNVSNIVKYNNELTSYLNLKLGTNINFFS